MDKRDNEVQWEGWMGALSCVACKGHIKQFGFYSKCKENIFPDFKQGSDAIQLKFLKTDFSSWVETELQIRVKKNGKQLGTFCRRLVRS